MTTKNTLITEHIETEKMPEVNNAVESSVKKNLVQIQVDTTEMKRRIAAFKSRKRKEVDEWNVQQFCGRNFVDEQDPSWVSKVENHWGPQIQLQPQAKKIKQEPSDEQNQQNDPTLEAVEERLQNMESHLKLKSDSSLRANIFQRLKDLEDRILVLEGLSPEYIHLSSTDYSSPKKKCYTEKEKMYSNLSMDELQRRIQSLKESFKGKLPQVKAEPPV